MGACVSRLATFDAIESCAKGCWDIASIDRVVLELDSDATPGKCQQARQWTSQHGRHVRTDPAEPMEICDRGLRNHEGVEEPTRRAELLDHALADAFAKMGGINEP